MSGLVYGSLFSGYEGLSIGCQRVLPGRTAWVSDIDKGANRILAHRFPDVPNLGDISAVKWTPDCPTCGDLLALYWNDDMPEGRGYYCPRDGWFDLDIWRNEPGVAEPVDVLTGGFPCQDVSHAGKRAGLRPDTRTGLWSQMAYAIDQLRPALVVAENVRGLLSAEAHSDLEPCPWCMGDGSGGAPLRALGAVLGDLADIGYDASWYGLRAADIGAPHGRFRVFVVAYPAGNQGRIGYGDGRATADADGRLILASGARSDQRPVQDSDGRGASSALLLPTPATSDTNGPGAHGDGGLDLRTAVAQLLPTPRATDGTKGGPNQRGSSGDLMLPSAVALLPTPAVNDMGAAYTPDEWDAWTDRMKAEHGNGNGHGKSLSIEAARLLGTPTARMSERSEEFAREGATPAEFARAHDGTWGEYADAIHRWEALTRPAPAPTMTSTKGNPQLAPTFVEWMMGLPAGWVTDVPGITRNEALKALGNGVVPAQAEAALRFLLSVQTVAA